jgi:hypothetical protein
MKKEIVASRKLTEGERAFKNLDLSKADLHLHSDYSDGNYGVAEVLQRAKAGGAQVISITDHDGIQGIPEAREIAIKMGNLRLVSGVEFSAEGPLGEELHILGYYFDGENPALLGMIEWMKSQRRERNRRLFEVMSSEGVFVGEEDFLGESNFHYIGKPLIAKKMVEKGYITQPAQAFQSGVYFGSESWRRVKKNKVTSKEAIEKIRGAGGAAVLAHPLKIKKLGKRNSESFWHTLEELLRVLKEQGLFGLECYYPEHTQEEEERLLGIARDVGLSPSKGSDFHGQEED